jgi:hypothetical protein
MKRAVISVCLGHGVNWSHHEVVVTGGRIFCEAYEYPFSQGNLPDDVYCNLAVFVALSHVEPFGFSAADVRFLDVVKTDSDNVEVSNG